MINYIGISLDHSGSMSSLQRAAAEDYNKTIRSIQDNARATNQDTWVSVSECGYEHTYSARMAIAHLPPSFMPVIAATDYSTSGYGTPLFDSVGMLIEAFEGIRPAGNRSFLILAITDGMENASKRWSADSIAHKIKQLQGTDRWTFAFRVPRGYSNNLIRLGIPPQNILEWDQTEEGMRKAGDITTSSVMRYFADTARGVAATKTFYSADLSNVTSKQVDKSLEDISSSVLLWPVSKGDSGKQLRDFAEERLNGERYRIGAAFYQLVKPEAVQDHKRIVIRDKKSYACYEGPAARKLLGWPANGSIKTAPGDLGNFDLFIQSTSVNRKVTPGTNLLYWRTAAKGGQCHVCNGSGQVYSARESKLAACPRCQIV